MQRLKQIAKETEIKDYNKNEQMCMAIVKHLEMIIESQFNLDLPDGTKLTYLNVITTILMIPSYSQYKEILLKLFEIYNINEKGLLLHLLGVINQIKQGVNDIQAEFTRTQFISSFMDLPYIQNFKYDKQMMEFDTRYGHVKLFSYDKIVKNERVYNIMKTIPLAQKCHNVVEYFKDEYKDDYIVTSEIPFLFSGNMYHSYFSTDEGVIDLSNNIFYPKDIFKDIFVTKEILRVKSSEFDEKFNVFLQEENIVLNDNLAPVLALALNNKRKN